MCESLREREDLRETERDLIKGERDRRERGGVRERGVRERGRGLEREGEEVRERKRERERRSLEGERKIERDG